MSKKRRMARRVGSTQPDRDWIPVEQARYDEGTSSEECGVHFRVYMSPYDMPDAVRGDYDSTSNKFVIRFRYIDAEPVMERGVDGFVTFFVGKNSGRLYRIEADVDALGANAVVLEVSKAIDDLAGDIGVHKHLPLENYRVAKDVLLDNRQRLVQRLSGAARGGHVA